MVDRPRLTQTQGIVQRQEQKLIMTPQMQLAVKMLSMSTMELDQRIQAELIENPMLELSDIPREEDEARTEAETEAENREKQGVALDELAFSQGGEEPNSTQMGDETHSGDDAFHSASDEDGNLGMTEPKTQEVWANNVAPDIDTTAYRENSELLGQAERAIREKPDENDEFSPLERAFQPPSLVDHLREQLSTLDLSESDLFVAELILGNLDDNGYLNMSDDGDDSGASRKSKSSKPKVALKNDAAQEGGDDGFLDDDGAEEGTPAPEKHHENAFQNDFSKDVPEDSFVALGRLTHEERVAASGMSFTYENFGCEDVSQNGKWSVELVDRAQILCGYWGDPLVHVVAEARWTYPNVTYASAADVLRKIQKLDPIGVASRSITECLLIQLDELIDRVAREKRRQKSGANVSPMSLEMKTIVKELKYLDFDLARDLIRQHWDLVKKRDLGRLEKAIGVDRRQLNEVLDFFGKWLQPRPGLEYCGEATIHLRPDVEISALPPSFTQAALYSDSFFVPEEYLLGFRVELCRSSRFSDRIRLSEMARKIRNKGEKNEELSNIRNVKKVREDLNNAEAFIRAIRSRESTIEKVAYSILKHQLEFMKKGPNYLRPLTLRDVAEDIQMHESTVSRIASSKCIQTPHGLWPIKFFFSASIRKPQSGGEVSNEVVRQRIRAIIDGEDLQNPLSDQNIVSILESEDIVVARRTVAKYRSQLNILSADRRRKY